MPRPILRRSLLRSSVHVAVLAAAGITAAPALARGVTASAPDRIAPGRIDWRAEPLRLLMVEARGCLSCAAWNREIRPGFAGSAAGRAAPLLVVDIDGPWPDGLALARRPTVTPTFVLLRGGAELSRLDGYPGDRFFYPLLAGMLTQAGFDASDKELGG